MTAETTVLGDLIAAALEAARTEERTWADLRGGGIGPDKVQAAQRDAEDASRAMWQRLAEVAPDETGAA